MQNLNCEYDKSSQTIPGKYDFVSRKGQWVLHSLNSVCVCRGYYIVMSKELPYFRFYPDEWFNGRISLENDTTQNLFLKISAWYWKKDCELSLDMINKRFINGKAMLKQCLKILIDTNLIKLSDNEMISIDFLNEQYDILSEKRQKLVEAGRLGGQASVKHRLSYKENYKDKDKERDKLPDKKSGDFIQQILDIFCQEYENSRKSEYVLLTTGRDRKAIGELLKLHKAKNSNKDSIATLQDFKDMFKSMLQISDKYHYDKMSPSHIKDNINQLKSIRYGNHQKPPATSDAEFDAIFGRDN